MQEFKFELFADYFQFYLMDTENSDDTSEIWREKANELKLGILPNTLAVGTLRNVVVPVEIHIHDEEPEINLENWDHASIGHFAINSGKCSVLGCTDYLPDAEVISLKSGNYSALSLAQGLGSIIEEWEEAEDLYRIVIWPSDSKEYKLLKKYENT